MIGLLLFGAVLPNLYVTVKSSLFLMYSTLLYCKIFVSKILHYGVLCSRLKFSIFAVLRMNKFFFLLSKILHFRNTAGIL